MSPPAAAWRPHTMCDAITVLASDVHTGAQLARVCTTAWTGRC